MSESVDWTEVKNLLDALYTASDRLECLFPGRKFTLDGHLVGSIGEVIAAYMFDLKLSRASNRGHDATTKDGRRVEIKFTQGSSAAIRYEPDHLIVLQRPKGGPVRVAYNGSGAVAWAAAGLMAANGQRPISVAKLLELDQGVQPSERLRELRSAPV